MSSIVAVEPGSAAGALVYWSLSGAVELLDLEECLAAEGLDGAFVPAPPSKDVALYRAAQDQVRTKRDLVRPLGAKRQGYVFVSETPVEGSDKHLEYVERVVCTVVRPKDGAAAVQVRAVTPGDQPLADAILANAHAAEGILLANDISSWLLWVLRKHVQAVSLRERGGFYFVPRDRLETWQQVARVVRACSAHQLYEIPAMRTEEAVEAILTAVRNEAADCMREMEGYLEGEVSTRGLNSWERRLAELQSKLKHYSELLGVALPDLDGKAENLRGQLQAARIIVASQDSMEAAQ